MAELAIELEGCTFSYDGLVPALRDVSCSIEAGSWVALVGENGSGKSTLGKLCNGLLRPRQGRVCIMGEDIHCRSVGEVARQVGYLFQNPDHQIFAPTVREEVTFDLRNLGLPRSEVERRVDSVLDQLALRPYADRPPAVLGYGLRRQVTLASLLARRPSILILDEPTTGLDWETSQVLLDHLRQQHDGGSTVLLITHDMRLVAEHVSRVLVLNRGRLVATGPTREILARSRLLARASITPPPVTRLSQELRPCGMKGHSLTIDEFYREVVALLAERVVGAPSGGVSHESSGRASDGGSPD
ncbi:MAG: energy-coupling factor ABC transporter ATP-binding protein [Chloroflexota bacterium]